MTWPSRVALFYGIARSAGSATLTIIAPKFVSVDKTCIVDTTQSRVITIVPTMAGRHRLAISTE